MERLDKTVLDAVVDGYRRCGHLAQACEAAGTNPVSLRNVEARDHESRAALAEIDRAWAAEYGLEGDQNLRQRVSQCTGHRQRSARLADEEPEDAPPAPAADDAPLWTPLDGPQRQAYESEADILLYGGAAGGGKSADGAGSSSWRQLLPLSSTHWLKPYRNHDKNKTWT